ncbi:MAG: hypothetical protein LBV04_08015 [Deferribacteraceae bacterium]|jgi:exopolyphosphatase/guanosine-5'-triphosphate,3'-diphosphate pyrophosphatase|nr:hypothetical protein [Deferribacteraceae bacterium]
MLALEQNIKQKSSRMGIINVGASAFRMYVAEYFGKEERQLDFLIKPLRLGKETFNQGYIGLENVKKAVDILNMFRLKLEEYGITDYKAVCTSGVREATNRDFFLDYTHLHSGIKLEVLDPTEEIYIKYAGARETVPGFKKLESEGLVFANVSSGNVALNISRKDFVLYSGSLPYGSLRLRQMFNSISHLKRHKAVEDYVHIMISRVMSTLDPSIKLKHLLGAGSSVNMLIRLFELGEDNSITLTQLKDVYEGVRTMSLAELQQATGLRKDEASVLVPTLITYMNLLAIVGSSSFSFSTVTFPRTLSLYYSGHIDDGQAAQRVSKTLINTAKRYRVNLRHAKWVSIFARTIFDQLDDLHSLESKYRLILEAAVMLNDVGYYISDTNLAGNSLYIISSLNIPGADPDMLRLAGCVVFEANRMAQRDPEEYADLSRQELLAIRKLAGILRVAKALDHSRNRYIYDINVEMGDQIEIYAQAEREPYLEIYSFNLQKQLFIETFGVNIELKAEVNYD